MKMLELAESFDTVFYYPLVYASDLRNKRRQDSDFAPDFHSLNVLPDHPGAVCSSPSTELVKFDDQTLTLKYANLPSPDSCMDFDVGPERARRTGNSQQHAHRPQNSGRLFAPFGMGHLPRRRAQHLRLETGASTARDRKSLIPSEIHARRSDGCLLLFATRSLRIRNDGGFGGVTSLSVQASHCKYKRFWEKSGPEGVVCAMNAAPKKGGRLTQRRDEKWERSV